MRSLHAVWVTLARWPLGRGLVMSAPLALIWLGLPLAGALASINPWLIPLASLLLLASLAYLSMALASASA